MRIAFLALASTLAVASCGSREPTPDASSPVDPPASVTSPISPPPQTEGTTDGGDAGTCDLLTTEEVAGEVGPVSDGVPPDPTSCLWAAEGGQISVSLAVLPVPAATCRRSRPGAASDVGGLGVEAWWEFLQAETTVGMLVVCSEDRQVIVSVQGGGEASVRAAAEQLAGRALTRL